MKTLKLAILLIAFVSVEAHAYTVGTGSSVEVATVRGTVTQVGAYTEKHQGVELGVSTDATSSMTELGTYSSKLTSNNTMTGTLNSTTTTQKGFSFFDN